MEHETCGVINKPPILPFKQTLIETDRKGNILKKGKRGYLGGHLINTL